jgi:hypothetical protein
MRHTIRTAVFLLGAVLALPGVAKADVTAFWGFSPTETTRPSRGFAFGLSLLVVGFEIEYANTAESPTNTAPGMTTGMINAMVQTPTRKTQLYLTTGGGFYRERLGSQQETSLGTNVGGGVKLGLAGPVRLRLDYRVFNLRGDPIQRTSQRFYAGLNIAF